MKNIRFIISFFILVLFVACDNVIVFGPAERHIYDRMGYYSILNYRYLRYTGDSAVLQMSVQEIEGSKRHYNKSSIYVGNDSIACVDELPFDIEIPIPIVNDSVFKITHVCWVDSVNSFRDTLIHTAYVHKSEIVNPVPDTVSIVRDRLDTVIVETYYTKPDNVWWRILL